MNFLFSWLVNTQFNATLHNVSILLFQDHQHKKSKINLY